MGETEPLLTLIGSIPFVIRSRSTSCIVADIRLLNHVLRKKTILRQMIKFKDSYVIGMDNAWSILMESCAFEFDNEVSMSLISKVIY